MSFSHIQYVRSGQPDLTHRQMAMMILIRRDGKGTVRGMAAELDVEKAVITRGANALTEHGLAKRVRDITDKRNVFIVPTPKGQRFLAEVM